MKEKENQGRGKPGTGKPEPGTENQTKTRKPGKPEAQTGKPGKLQGTENQGRKPGRNQVTKPGTKTRDGREVSVHFTNPPRAIPSAFPHPVQHVSVSLSGCADKFLFKSFPVPPQTPFDPNGFAANVARRIATKSSARILGIQQHVTQPGCILRSSATSSYRDNGNICVNFR